MLPNMVKVMAPKNTPRTCARTSAASTTRPIMPPYRVRSAGSCTKLCTVRIWLNASSASAVASATLSCTPVLIRRSRLPKKSAVPTATGTTASAVSVSRGWIQVSSRMPPTSDSTCRENSATWWLSTPCRRPMSVVRRLVSSPVFRSAKNPGGWSSSLAKSSARSPATARSPVALRR